MPNAGEYLFLYPIGEYFKEFVNPSSSFTRKGNSAKKMFDIIDVRYRNQGYGVNWLLFRRLASIMPDLSDLPPFVKMQKNDRILAADLLLIGMDGFDGGQREYVNAVLDQLPAAKRLVLGGFHQQDCVDKMASAAHTRGIDVF